MTYGRMIQVSKNPTASRTEAHCFSARYTGLEAAQRKDSGKLAKSYAEARFITSSSVHCPTPRALFRVAGESNASKKVN